MNDILLTVLEGIIIILVMIITRYVVPYLKYKLMEITNEVLIREIVQAVKSVEQDVAYRIGIEKKEEVMVRITGWANQHGISITQAQLSHLIEAAVWTMKKEGNAND